MYTGENKAYEYACWCIENDDGKIGRYIKKQAKFWVDIVDGNDNEAYFDKKQYNAICEILKIMTHPDTRKSMYDSLENYQWFFIVAVLCTRHRENNSRYYETGLLEISRKNFKTFTAGIIFIICLIIEPQFSRFFSVAPNYKLSCELKLAVDKIIKCSPALRDKFKINTEIVRCKINDSEYTPLAYSNDSLDGKLAVVFNIDEAGLLPDYPLEAMRSSQITLKDKLGIVISTQYPNDCNVMLTEIDIAKKTLDRLIDSKRYFALLYEPDEEIREKWQEDDNVIYQSNPVAVNNKPIFDEIVKKRTMAILYESKRENYLCKHNNIKYKGLGTEGFIEITKVQACKVEEDLRFWRGKKVYLAFDLSQTSDNTAVAMVTEYDDEVYAKVWAFIPEERIDLKTKRESVDYKSLIKDGVCFACGDEVISYNFVEDFILSLEEKYGVEIMQIGYDRWNALSTAQKLETEGYELVEIKQHSSVLHMPTKLLDELVLSKKFHYESNRLLEINFQNARCTYDNNKNRYVNKKKSEGKVDMVVALINALYLLQQEQLNGEYDFTIQII